MTASFGRPGAKTSSQPTMRLWCFLRMDELLVEVGLQVGSAVQVVLLHEFLNTRTVLPLHAVVLVSADVHVGIGEDGGHFSDELVEKLVGALARGIHHWIED